MYVRRAANQNNSFREDYNTQTSTFAVNFDSVFGRYFRRRAGEYVVRWQNTKA